MQEAIERVLQAVEYYEMVHDTGEEKQTEKNKDYVWKGYDRLIDILNENKWSIKNYRRIIEQAFQDAGMVDRVTCEGMQNRRQAAAGEGQRLLWLLCNEGLLCF